MFGRVLNTLLNPSLHLHAESNNRNTRTRCEMVQKEVLLLQHVNVVFYCFLLSEYVRTALRSAQQKVGKFPKNFLMQKSCRNKLI